MNAVGTEPDPVKQEHRRLAVFLFVRSRRDQGTNDEEKCRVFYR